MVGAASDSDFGVARLNTDGTLDSGFGTAGRVATNVLGYDVATAVAIQPGGKILVAGYSVPFYEGIPVTYDFALVRYNSDGTLDADFGTGGMVTTDFGSDDFARAVAVQPDGKIIVAGTAYVSSWDFAIARYNADGTLDDTFNFDGLITVDIGPYFDEVATVVVLADGKILAGGTGGGGADFAIVRLTSEGALDDPFGIGGIVTTDFSGLWGGPGGSNDVVLAIDVAPTGAILAAGRTHGSTCGFCPAADSLAIAQYDANGVADPGSMVAAPFFAGSGADLNTVKILSNSDILAAGGVQTPAGVDFALARYDADDNPNVAFGSLATDFNGSYDNVYGIVEQADGRIAAAGAADIPGENLHFAVARYVGSAP